MGRLLVSMMVSVDGHFDGPDAEAGSLAHIDEPMHRYVNQVAAGASSLIYGRKVYEVMIPYWPDAAKDESRPTYETEYGRIWVEKPKVVFSRTLKDAAFDTRVVNDGLFEEIERLKRAPDGYVLSYGGAEIVAQLEERNLVDEYLLFVNPVTVGRNGIPLFRAPLSLKLLESRTFDVGTVALRYAVTRTT